MGGNGSRSQRSNTGLNSLLLYVLEDDLTVLLAKPCRFAKSVGQSGTDPALVLSIVHLTDPKKCPNAPAEVRKTAAGKEAEG